MNSKHRSHKPGMREVSQRQARGNADQAGETRKSHRPGVEDDSEIVQSLVATLGAPVEGALDSMHERERAAERGEDAGPDQVGGISGQRAADVPRVEEGADRQLRGKVPTKPEDAEAEPSEIAEDMSRDRPGTER